MVVGGSLRLVVFEGCVRIDLDVRVKAYSEC